MQCSSSYVRDISRLVQMIEEEEQCTINQVTSRASSTLSAAGDEGIDMEYALPSQGVEALVGMPQWKAGDRRDSCTRVARTVRMRKRSGRKVEKRRAS